MGKPRIKPVEDNYKKGNTYARLIEQYNLALEGGFYGEAELIVYAFLEDRLRSFLYYSNGLDHWNSAYINENMQKVYGGELRIFDIGCKLTVIEAALKIAESGEANVDDYYMFLRTVYHASIDVNEFKKNIKQIRKWCDYRNEVVHAMFNKDLDVLRKGFKEHVETGFQYARIVDAQVRKLKNS